MNKRMKVRCIDDGNLRYLTKDKIYPVVKDFDEHAFTIIDNSGNENNYFKERFEIVEEIDGLFTVEGIYDET